ncbi:hypothetical protein B0H11DRAFT_1988320 [Mycena galericulata]|nr:hypothetical protein B0H11DRAFT_1988320 [Mycena galericulata]
MCFLSLKKSPHYRSSSRNRLPYWDRRIEAYTSHLNNATPVRCTFAREYLISSQPFCRLSLWQDRTVPFAFSAALPLLLSCAMVRSTALSGYPSFRSSQQLPRTSPSGRHSNRLSISSRRYAFLCFPAHFVSIYSPAGCSMSPRIQIRILGMLAWTKACLGLLQARWMVFGGLCRPIPLCCSRSPFCFSRFMASTYVLHVWDFSVMTRCMNRKYGSIVFWRHPPAPYCPHHDSYLKLAI